MTEYVQVKDFDRFQHYKDRDPPWIKLYVRILDDYAFGKLPDAYKAHLVSIWVLASKMDNKIPADAVFIGNRIVATEPVNLPVLIASGFLQPWNPKTASGKREEWASRYVSAQVRSALLSSAQNLCAACGSSEALEIDHIVPVSRGGTGDESNLQVLCRKCNRQKRAKLREEAAEQEAPQMLRRRTDLRTPETETEREAETETEKHGRGKTTWLTPFADVWATKCGTPPYGKLGKILRPLVQEHGEAEVLERWRKYVDATEPRYASVHRFAETFVSWGAPTEIEMTDDVGVMRLHRLNPVSGEYEVA